MSSGFVSGGTTEYTTEKDGEWQKVKEELEASRKRRAEQGTQAGGKSLYEVLQQNKAAKQEAFEESIRLKNQFRTLDEDEVEFLDSLLESTRAREDAVRKETMEQLELFHRQREEAEKKVLLNDNGTDKPGAGSPVEEETWTLSNRKRRRGKDTDALPGVKTRKSSTVESQPPSAETSSSKTTPGTVIEASRSSTDERIPSSPDKGIESHTGARIHAETDPKPPKTTGSSTLGLAAYSSDDDD